MVVCKNCGEEIVSRGAYYVHANSLSIHCQLMAELRDDGGVDVCEDFETEHYDMFVGKLKDRLANEERSSLTDDQLSLIKWAYGSALLEIRRKRDEEREKKKLEEVVIKGMEASNVGESASKDTPSNKVPTDEELARSGWIVERRNKNGEVIMVGPDRKKSKFKSAEHSMTLEKAIVTGGRSASSVGTEPSVAPPVVVEVAPEPPKPVDETALVPKCKKCVHAMWDKNICVVFDQPNRAWKDKRGWCPSYSETKVNHAKSE